jgi:hypothetical protein
VRDFPEGFYADRCLLWMGAAPPVRDREPRRLASARLDARILARLHCPNTDGPRHEAPILLVQRKAQA